VDKIAYIRSNLPQVSGAHILLYIFQANVLRALSGEFSDIQQIFFPDLHSRCICLLLEEESQLTSTYLAIIGPAAFQGECAREHQNRGRQRIEAAQQTRRDQVSWIDFETGLTPYHLMLPFTDCPNGAITTALARKFYALVLIHLAESVRRTDGDYLANFGGVARVGVHIPAGATGRPGDPASLARLFMWSYSEKAPDKLQFVRSVAASLLTDDSARNYMVFAEAGARILASSRSNYASYIHGFVTRHFEKLQEVDEYVQGIANQLSDQVADLAKNLTSSMLASVALVVAGLVAYAVNPKVPPKVFSVGLILYGAYIVAFPLISFLLFHNLFSYLITIREFRARLMEFQVALQLPNLPQQLTHRMRWRTRHFWFMFTVSCLAFIGVAFTCYRLSRYIAAAPIPKP
jgi:hypothetical protein